MVLAHKTLLHPVEYDSMMEPETAMTSQPIGSKLIITASIATAILLTLAIYLNKTSEKWVPDAEAKVKAAQLRKSGDSIVALMKSAQDNKTSVAIQMEYARALTDKGLFVKALGPAELAVKIDPNNAEANLLLAEICSPLDYREDAIYHYREAIRLNPGLLEAYQHLGDLLFAAGKLVESEKVFMSAHEHVPDSPGPVLSLSELYSQQGQQAKAAKILEPLIKKGDAPVAVLFMYGKAANSVGQSSTGIDALTQAVKKSPEFADAHHALGSALANQSKYEEGIKELLKALELAPDNSNFRYALGNAFLFDTALPNHLDLARTTFEQSLEKDSSSQWAHYYYGMTLEQQGEDDAAAREYRRVLEINKEFASGYYRLGAIYKRQGRVEEGKRLQAYFDRKNREAITTVHGQRKDNSEVDNAEYRYQRGVKALKAGKKPLALSEFKAALDRDPNHLEAKQALAKLTTQ